MKNEELSLNEIITYAKQKTAVILSSLILSVIGIIVGGIFLLLEGLKITDSKIGFYAILLFLISMATSIVLISHYEKMRSKLINKMDTKSFSVFFDYFTINEQISNFAQSYPANSITASIEAPLLINRYRFVSCSCFSCFCKKA